MSTEVTPDGAIHDVEPVEVNDSTMYFVPVMVPEISLLLPVIPVRPVEVMLNDNATPVAAL